MSNTNIQTIEGTEYKVTLNVSGVANLTDTGLKAHVKPLVHVLMVLSHSE